MRSRVAAVGLALAALLPLLAGCAAPAPPPREVVPPSLSYEPSTISVESVSVEDHTVTSWDGVTQLAVRAYVPELSAPAKPALVLFVHGWGGNKEGYEGQESYPVANPVGAAAGQGPNRLQAFAEAGFLAVAYDARGFGQSTGAVTVAGAAEMADLDHILAWANQTYATNGRVGVVGASYGGGHAYNAWATNPRVTTAVPMYGWVDLYQALLPGNVPKLEWAQFLYYYGQVGTGDYDPMIHDWYSNLYLRGTPASGDIDLMRAQMDERSILPRGLASTKPLLACQGMEESLFPQADQAWGLAQASGAFVRAYVFRGGHGASADGCWERALDWFRFFLAGYDTRVDAWPALETVDAGSDTTTAYAEFPDVAATSYRLRSGDLYQGEPSQWSFAVSQRGVANPIAEPAALWDQSGLPANEIPDALREDPGAVVFQTPLLEAGTLLGAPELTLALHGENAAPFQVAATLLVLHNDGSSRIVSRAAAAALDGDDVADGTLDLRFHWTKAELAAGDRIVLKLSANDPTWWMPLLANYEVSLDGRSELRLPILG